MFKFAVGALSALVLTTVLSTPAQAGHPGCGSYYGGYQARFGGYGYAGVYAQPFQYRVTVPYSVGYGVPHAMPRYHDTTHYDYHPPVVVQHRRHFHVQPGHFDLHRDGHWD